MADHDQPQPNPDPYVRLARLVAEFDDLAPLLPTTVDDETKPEKSWIIGSARQVLGKAMTVIERDF